MNMINNADIIFSVFQSDLQKNEKTKTSSQFNELILSANGWLLFLL